MLINAFSGIVGWLVKVIGSLGYLGITGLMFLESSFFPFPSEVVMPPAGYLAQQGQMSLPLVLLCGIVGSLLGALFNYWIALKFGRPFFRKYGRYVGVTPEVLDKADRFFERHGHISTFVGRLVPVIRQYISLPAGIARMNLAQFCLYTTLGAGIWSSVLTLLGYFLGANQAIIHRDLSRASGVLVALSSAVVALYVWHLRRKKFRDQNTAQAQSSDVE